LIFTFLYRKGWIPKPLISFLKSLFQRRQETEEDRKQERFVALHDDHPY
jgi:hypothetical protein